MTDLIKPLEANGWQSFHDAFSLSDYAFAKSFCDHEECICNKKGRKQVEVYLYEHGSRLSVSIKCTGELSDESWIRLELDLSGEITMESIAAKANEILTVWDFAARNNREIAK